MRCDQTTPNKFNTHKKESETIAQEPSRNAISWYNEIPNNLILDRYDSGISNVLASFQRLAIQINQANPHELIAPTFIMPTNDPKDSVHRYCE